MTFLKLFQLKAILNSKLLQSSDTAEIVEALEDSQMTLASLAASRYAAPFREEVTAWLSKLASVSEQVLLPLVSILAISHLQS